MTGIIVGVDESEGAAHALRWAVRESEIRQWPVTAVMAWGFLDQHRVAGERFDPAYREADALAALDAVVMAAVGHEGAGVVGRRAICDLAPSALLDAAIGADMLVVGRRGLGGFRELLLGSVSHEVVRRAPCPVAVIGAGPGAEPRQATARIVVGVDGSDTSKRALRWAIDEGRARRAAVEAVHVWRAPYVDGYGFAAAGLDPTAYEAGGRRLLDDMVDAEDTSGLPVPVERTLTGDGAARALLEAAKSADLLVVGSRGVSGVTRLVLGSVSHQVIHHAPCPVVVVPPTVTP